MKEFRINKGATGRVQTGNQQYPALCNCQPGQDIKQYLEYFVFIPGHSKLAAFQS